MQRRACKCGLLATKKCGQCKRTWYCGRECQSSDWVTHKEICARKCVYGKIIRAATSADVVKYGDWISGMGIHDAPESALAPVLIRVGDDELKIILLPKQNNVINGVTIMLDAAELAPIPLLTTWTNEAMFLSGAELLKHADLIAKTQNKSILWFASLHSLSIGESEILAEFINIIEMLGTFPTVMNIMVEFLCVCKLYELRDAEGPHKRDVGIFINFIIGSLMGCNPHAIKSVKPISFGGLAMLEFLHKGTSAPSPQLLLNDSDLFSEFVENHDPELNIYVRCMIGLCETLVEVIPEYTAIKKRLSG